MQYNNNNNNNCCCGCSLPNAIKQWIRFIGVITVYIRQWSNGSRRLIMLLVLMLLVNVVVGYDHSVNYWQAFAPGKLLQRLDALTSTADLPRAQPKLDESIEATDVDVNDDVDVEAEAEAEADSQSVEAQSGEDYERNYEQFVREYFDRTDDDGEGDAEALEDSVETQAEASNVQPAKKKQNEKKESQRCRSVHRHGQLCKICREARNNEVSETCSYSHEAEPERYAYGSGTKYKRYRDMDNDDDDDDDDDDESTRRRRRQQDQENSSNNNSLCERRLIGKSVCYECKDSGGQRLKRCYDTETNKQISSNGDSETGTKKEQRIYKRTISYTYQQNDNDDDDDAPTTTTTTTTTASTTPTPVKKRLSRIVRRRVAIPVSYLI